MLIPAGDILLISLDIRHNLPLTFGTGTGSALRRRELKLHTLKKNGDELGLVRNVVATLPIPSGEKHRLRTRDARGAAS
jgi:hypothetical protein